jgi:hypothetical protein
MPEQLPNHGGPPETLPTPLRRVRLLEDGVAVDRLLLADPELRALAEQVADDGDALVRLVEDAAAIGARVLARETAGQSADWLREQLTSTADHVTASVAASSEDLLGLVRSELDRLFGSTSTEGLPAHLRERLDELLSGHQRHLKELFSSAGDENPLSLLRAETRAAIARSGEETAKALRDLVLVVTEMRAGQAAETAVAAERDRSAAKGRPYEEQVAAALEQLAAVQGDVVEAVGDVPGAVGKSGDVIVDLAAGRGRPVGRLVWEAKTTRLTRPEATRQLDRAISDRGADFAVLIVSKPEHMPSGMRQLCEYGADKLAVVYDPDEVGGALPLEVAYALARARVTMRQARGETLDPELLHNTTENILGTLEQVRVIKRNLTQAGNGITQARAGVEAMVSSVRAQVEALTAALEQDDPPAS